MCKHNSIIAKKNFHIFTSFIMIVEMILVCCDCRNIVQLLYYSNSVYCVLDMAWSAHVLCVSRVSYRIFCLEGGGKL